MFENLQYGRKPGIRYRTLAVVVGAMFLAIGFNLKASGQIGLTIPPRLLSQVDRIK
jgi:hypothetical protein